MRQQGAGGGPQPFAPELFLAESVEHVVGIVGEGLTGQTDRFAAIRCTALDFQTDGHGQGGFRGIRFDLEHLAPTLQGLVLAAQFEQHQALVVDRLPEVGTEFRGPFKGRQS